jgi:hypothetical protein
MAKPLVQLQVLLQITFAVMGQIGHPRATGYGDLLSDLRPILGTLSQLHDGIVVLVVHKGGVPVS